MAAWGVLKPATKVRVLVSDAPFWRRVGLTEADLFVESNAAGCLLGEQFFGIKENTFLLLESSLSLQCYAPPLPECLSYGTKVIKISSAIK